MPKVLLMLIGLILLVVGTQGASLAEEELFDTATANVYVEKGISHLKSRNYTAAAAELEEAILIAPDAEAYYYLGYAYYMQGRTGDSESRKKSIECFEKAYDLDPNFTPTRYKASESIPAERPVKKAKTAETGTGTQPQQPADEAGLSSSGTTSDEQPR